MASLSGISSYLGIYQIPHGHCGILERHGRFVKVLESGLHMTGPFTSLKSLADWTWVKKSDSNAALKQEVLTCAKPGNLMELSHQQWTTDPFICYTKDRVETRLSANLEFRIKDPYKAAYSIDVMPSALHNACNVVMQSTIAKADFGLYRLRGGSKFLDEQDRINQDLLKNLQARVESWGVEVIRVEMGSIWYNKADALAAQSKNFFYLDRLAYAFFAVSILAVSYALRALAFL